MWFVQALLTCFFVVIVGSIIKSELESPLGLFLAACYIALQSARQLFRAVIHSVERMEFETFALLIERGIALLGTYIVLQLGGNIIDILYVFLASQILGILSYCGSIYHILREIPIPKFSLGTWHELGKMSIPFALNIMLSPIYTQADVVFLALLAGNSEAGIYRAASSLVYPLGMIAVSLSSALFPVMSKAAHLGRKSSHLSQKSLQLLLAISVPMSIGLIILADRFVGLFYASDYYESVNLVRILALMLPLRFVNNMLGVVLTSINHQRFRTFGVGIGTIVMVVLNLIFIPFWGYYAAAIVSVLTEIIITGLFFVFTREYVSLDLNLIKLFVANGILGILILVFQNLNLLLLILLGAFSYLIILILIRFWGLQEWKAVSQAILSKIG